MLGSKWWLSKSGKEVRRSSAKVRCHGIRSQMMEHVCLKSWADAGGRNARRGTAQSQSHFWVEILSKQMLTGRLQVHSKVRRHKHSKKPSFWQLDIQKGCVPMKQGARLSAPLGKPSISPILPYSSLWLHNLAVVLGLWTVNKPIFLKWHWQAACARFPYPSEWKSVIPHSAHPAALRRISLWLLWQLYFSIFMTSLISQVY